MEIKKFTFNAFSENTYLVSSGGEAAIFDPGMSNSIEESQVLSYLNENDLSLKHLINTHCHIDHVLGNQFIADKFGLPLISSEKEKLTLSFAPQSAQLWSIPFNGSPEIEKFIKEGDTLKIGESIWEIVEVSGHSVGHLIFYNKAHKVVIGGDTLFRGSIGRTDLPGGNHADLINNIKTKMFVLADDVTVYSGHGPETTIGFEKENNPFF